MIITKVELSLDSANAICDALRAAMQTHSANAEKLQAKIASEPGLETRMLKERFCYAACADMREMISNVMNTHASSDTKPSLCIVAVASNTSSETVDFTGSNYSQAGIMSKYENVAQI